MPCATAGAVQASLGRSETSVVSALGLKTASLSQCRRLTVITRQGGRTSAARWDLDLVIAHGGWVVGLLDDAEIDDLPTGKDLNAAQSGTVILWQDFDRALAGEAAPGEALGELVDHSRAHLAIAFHRFLHLWLHVGLPPMELGAGGPRFVRK